MHQQAPEESTVTTQVMSVDLNGSIQQNIDAHLNSNDLRSLDLNGSNHQQLDYSYMGSPDTKPHSTGYTDFYFSKDDLEKVQVFWNWNPRSLIWSVIICSRKNVLKFC